MSSSILSARHLTKKYNELTVLKDVSLDITKGSFIAIMGPSGAGKSTLLHLLGTLDKPDSGEVMYDGVNPFLLDKKKLANFRNQKLGFVFQFHHLLPEFTALENVCMPLWIAKTPKKKALHKATALLEKVGMSHRLHHKPSQLSGGEQQRVAIARAIAMDTPIIFADEPTGNLDSENAIAIHELFLQLKKELGVTIVVVTHNEELANIVDTLLHMKDGKIIQVEEKKILV